MKIQPKTKIFTWRAVRNILSTKSRLISKNIQIEDGCYLCNIDSEKVWHVLNLCPFAQSVLSFSNVQVLAQPNIHDSKTWLEFLQENFTKLPIEDRELLAVLWEEIWYQRNQKWQGKPTESPTQIFLQTTTRLSCFRRAQTCESWAPAENLPSEKWSPPPQGILKLNVDGASFDDENAIETRTIIRDWRGKFITASMKKFEGEAEPMRAEI